MSAHYCQELSCGDMAHDTKEIEIGEYILEIWLCPQHETELS